ncbi:MAG: Rid family detoxifying hydrolase [Prevotellaceae bacterium]|jgi:2-iminobutanoate/2-iminopropanoate deaminase|nr:Rid family detoxifying hydrolase [Prevotellaceae bacterium]
MKKVINSLLAPKAIGPYSQAIEANGTLYISGQLPVNSKDGYVPETIEAQVEQCFVNIYAILKEAGYGFENVVKSVVLLDDLANFGAMNEIYGKYYTKDMPARLCYQVCKLPMGVKVEIETTAVK